MQFRVLPMGKRNNNHPIEAIVPPFFVNVTFGVQIKRLYNVHTYLKGAQAAPVQQNNETESYTLAIFCQDQEKRFSL